jgi:hypothetical protein
MLMFFHVPKGLYFHQEKPATTLWAVNCGHKISTGEDEKLETPITDLMNPRSTAELLRMTESSWLYPVYVAIATIVLIPAGSSENLKNTKYSERLKLAPGDK